MRLPDDALRCHHAYGSKSSFCFWDGKGILRALPVVFGPLAEFARRPANHFSNITPDNLGAYAVVVTDAFESAASTPATLTMYPFITMPFTGASALWGMRQTFHVQAWGSGPLSYQWFDNGMLIPNATNQTLSFSAIQFTNAGLYSVVVSGPFGSATNTPEQVVVNPAGVSMGLYPGVTINGVVGYSYIIQETSDLSKTNSWVTLANITLQQPMQLWMDTNADASLPANPHRFYQVLPGQ